MRYFILSLFIIILAIFFYQYKALLFPGIEPELVNIGIKEKKDHSSITHFIPYNDSSLIEINPIVSLNGMNKQEVSDFRYEKVQENGYLDLFPDGYNPLEHPHSNIFNPIASGKEWINHTQFHVANPYLLLIATCQQRINPIMILSSDISSPLTYTGTSIEETYETDDATEWFTRVFNCPDNPGIIRLWMTNAFDAGFHYASLDQQKSENIDFNWNIGSSSIVNGIHSQPGYFHPGNHEKNNLSPSDKNGRVHILEKNVYTSIYIKLWQKKPSSVNQPEDFGYNIILDP